MIGIYLIAAIILSAGLFFNRNTLINNLLLVLFVSLQVGFTVFEWYHINTVELGYFQADALGILLLVTLSIVSVPALFHSHIYLVTHKETSPRVRAIYFSAMVMLITAIGAAYLANHIAVTWIFVEITTLCASALIYHHRNERSLEGTWKYVFICAISVSFIFIGILLIWIFVSALAGGFSCSLICRIAEYSHAFILTGVCLMLLLFTINKSERTSDLLAEFIGLVVVCTGFLTGTKIGVRKKKRRKDKAGQIDK